MLGFEEHPLFGDLLNHLGLLDLGAKPSKAWSRFKSGVGKLAKDRDVLWGRCVKLVECAFELPVGHDWSGDQISESYIGLFYQAVLKAGTNGPLDLEVLKPGEGLEVERQGGWREFKRNGTGLLKRKAKGADKEDNFRRWISDALRQLSEAAQGPDLSSLGRDIGRETKFLRKIGDNLARALDEALYYEVFPGDCRFTASPGSASSPGRRLK